MSLEDRWPKAPPPPTGSMKLKSHCVLTAPPYITKSWLNFTFSLSVRLAVVLNT